MRFLGGRVGRIVFAMAASTLPAFCGAVVTSLDFAPFTGVTVTNGGTKDVTINGTTVSGWTISAELCVDGFCGGGSGGAGFNPGAIHLTNVNIFCSSSTAPCNLPSLIFLNFSGTGLGIDVGAPLGVTMSADGVVNGLGVNGAPGVAKGEVDIAAFSGGPSAVLSLPFGPVNSFNLGPASGAATTSTPGFGFGGCLCVDSVTFGTTLHMGNSVDIQFDNGVPEPATWGLIGAGLFGMTVVRRRITFKRSLS